MPLRMFMKVRFALSLCFVALRVDVYKRQGIHQLHRATVSILTIRQRFKNKNEKCDINP